MTARYAQLPINVSTLKFSTGHLFKASLLGFNGPLGYDWVNCVGISTMSGGRSAAADSLIEVIIGIVGDRRETILLLTLASISLFQGHQMQAERSHSLRQVNIPSSRIEANCVGTHHSRHQNRRQAPTQIFGDSLSALSSNPRL